MSTPDLSKLLWLKNVNPKDKDGNPDEGRAYSGNSKTFKLHWPTDQKTNADRAEVGDLILLIQYTFVTHLVRLTDMTVREGKYKKFWWVREVECLWNGVATTPIIEKASDDVLGFKFRCRHGRIIALENCANFIKTQKTDSLKRLQDRVSKKLFITP